jgi:hypothetical protein
MTQLIGLPCVICSEPISTVIEGNFCPTCGCPVHTRCAKPRLKGPESCDACGAAPEQIAAHRKRAQGDEASFRLAFRRHRLTWGTLEVLGGPVCMVFGAVLFFSFSPLHAWLGALIIACGAGLTVHGIALLLRTNPRVRKDS